ncbi:glycosyltransferase family 4 protein [Providencia hangzhouensis]|uniref:glycosyltransferase family 4 protein n=3 Tax=Providencia hangzhouensis TaxID=3031799 RepID=UPI0034DD35FB
MNILFLCNEYPPFISGGIGVFTKELSVELTKLGHKIYVLGAYPNIKNKQIEVVNNITIIRINKKTGLIGELENRIRIYINAKKIIEENKIDIVETQDFNGPLAFYPKFKSHTLVRLHGSVTYFNQLSYNVSKKKKIKNFLWHVLESSSFKNADNIVSVSNFTSQKTKEIFNIKKNIPTIYNGIPLIQNYIQKSSFDEIKKFVFAGSIIEKKGILELIDAWIELDKHHKNIHLDVYGKDTEGLVKTITNILNKNNCNSVKIHPPVVKSDLLKIYNNADFCIYPSKAEAFSLAPMEAMSMSKVVLYTDQTSASELVNDSNGFLIEKCSVNKIYNCLTKALSLSIPEYNKISHAAFTTIKDNFSIDILTKKNIEYYQLIINK